MYIVSVSWFIEQGSSSGFETCRLFWLANIIEQPTAFKKPDFFSTSLENSLAVKKQTDDQKNSVQSN